MSNVLNLFEGLNRDQARQLQTLAMPILWQLRENIEAGETTFTMDLITDKNTTEERKSK